MALTTISHDIMFLVVCNMLGLGILGPYLPRFSEWQVVCIFG